MRFNKQELVALSSQTSQSFDREGVMVLKEKQDGFFRRSEGKEIKILLSNHIINLMNLPQLLIEHKEHTILDILYSINILVVILNKLPFF